MVSSPNWADQPEFPHTLADARGGSTEALGRLLMDCQGYLLVVAHRHLPPDIQSKVSPSDAVQDTFLKAHRAFRRFHGACAEELLAWLCHILRNNLANIRRHYRGTEKRALEREVSLAAGGRQTNEPPSDMPAPSARLAGREGSAMLHGAVAGLPENYRRVLHLRYHLRQTFAQIGATLSCSGEAARKVCVRAVDRLRHALDLCEEP